MATSRKRETAAVSPLALAAFGLLSGAAGAIAVSLAGAALQRRTDCPRPGSNHSDPDGDYSGEGGTAGEALAEGTDMPPNIDAVTAIFVQKIATGIFGTSLGRERRHVAGRGWHLLYGGFWGGIYALLRCGLRYPTALIGIVHAVIVWGIGPAWLVPKMKLMLPPNRQNRRALLENIGIHIVYSAVVAILFGWLRGGPGKRRGEES
jgi:hypothetical protein